MIGFSLLTDIRKKKLPERKRIQVRTKLKVMKWKNSKYNSIYIQNIPVYIL